MRIPNDLRDQLQTDFRNTIIQRIGAIPFEHQQGWFSLTDGYELLNDAPPGAPTVKVRLPDESVVERGLVARANGRARVVAELGAFKCGKSYGAALWAAGFAAVPNARVGLIGIEYDMCAPEFEYLLEFLVSDRGLGLKPKELQNRPKDGRLWLVLENGARFEARSWERAESLKGKEADAYIFCEAYQLPGIECFMGVKQNLRARNGYAIFPTTPDQPWISILHENGHDTEHFPDWACQCGIPASVNPYTYSAVVQASDQTMMTREKFSIAYLGKIGTYIGRVFAYQRGDKQFTTASHPDLWYDVTKGSTPENLKIPPNWSIHIGADTGTFMGAVVMAFDENGKAYVLDEVSNYRYVGNMIELESDTSIAVWAEAFKKMAAIWGARLVAWVDTNSQFKAELWNQHGIQLVGNAIGREVRTESARSFFQHDQIFLAPWLRLLPYELEHAQWPEESTSAGRHDRIKRNDHLIDGVEHLCAKHLRGTKPAALRSADDTMIYHSPKPRRYGDTHMGRD